MAAGLGGRTGFSTSALWFDYDRDGLLDLFVCNYVKWTPERDVFCSLDGKQKSYCTPEAYRGDTCWLFHNRGNGTFEDVTATCGIFDTSSKSLGVTMIDSDIDGWPDLFVANDTQPNKLYRNLRNGTFKDVAVEAGLAFSTEGKAQGRHGRRHRRLRQLRHAGHRGHELRQRDDRPVSPAGPRAVRRRGARDPASAPRRGTRSGSAARSRISISTATLIWSSPTGTSTRPCGTFAATSATRSPRICFSTRATARFATPPPTRAVSSRSRGSGGASRAATSTGTATSTFSSRPTTDRRCCFATIRRAGNRFVRFHLKGTTSNRDAIGATVRIFHGGTSQSRLVKSGSSYLSQSELPVTFGVGTRDRIDRVVVSWPNGRTEEFRNVVTGKAYDCVEGKGMLPS